MKFSARDCIYARVTLCKLLIEFADLLKNNVYDQILSKWIELINSIKKMLFVIKKSHIQYFGDLQKSSEHCIDHLINLKKCFFNSNLLLTLKAQSSVKSQYNPYFDYFRKSDKDCTEQYSRNPVDGFEFFENGKINLSI